MTTPTEGKAGKPPCPICNTVPNHETGRCRCPRPSDNRIPTPSLSSSALVAQAESLFESYLAARLVRARRALTVAKVALLRDPRDHAKLEALRTAELETQKLHSQLLEQIRRAAQIRERAASEGETSVASAQATEDFRTAQAAKAEAIYQPQEATESLRCLRPDARECPSCGERLPGDAVVCECGYEFAQDMVAEPFLTDEEVAALRGKPSKYQE